jgi:glyoxylase-like metal-dependent hydrolase (beta-lactamase superfamily II)
MLGKRHLFTGDTLFIDGIGRPDLKTDTAGLMRKASQLYYSLHLLLDLPAITKVLPGHTSNPVAFDGQPILTEIDQLRRTLSWLAIPEDEFIDQIVDRIPSTPPNYLTISELNQQGDFTSVDPVEVEAGANRCAIR